MWSTDKLNKQIEVFGQLNLFHDLYGDSEGYQLALTRISKLISKADFEVTHLFSAPGRTELGGNHTDHNLGKVFCAAVRNDTLAAVAKRSDGKIVLRSEGFSEVFQLNISDLAPKADEVGNTKALIRGILAGIEQKGGTCGGFSAEITSEVGMGSGLSSSASFEVLIGTIVNHLYNEDRFPATKIAEIAQFAENEYFGKPCGLMDQMASAVGGVLSIDFENPQSPAIRQVELDLEAEDFVLLVINTGSSHADLTPAYASIPMEMRAVAQEMGVENLREMEESVLQENIASLRNKLGDRAVLRALHFYAENRRVDAMVKALEVGDFEAYLREVTASGRSSQNILQNSIPPNSDGKDQGLTYALGLSQIFFEEKGRGLARVHGGGFAGTIQAYIHKADLEDYLSLISRTLGSHSTEILTIRHHGATPILSLAR